MNPEATVVASFAEVRAALERALPAPTASFRPPASRDELQRLGKALGRPVPLELAALLTVANGQDDVAGASGSINDHRFLGVGEIIDMHRMLDAVVGDLSMSAPQPSSYTDLVWSPAWIPFLASEGDCYAIDMAPGEAGRVGQVLFRPNVPDLDEPKAPSLAAFLQTVVEIIEAGDYEVSYNSIVSPRLL